MTPWEVIEEALAQKRPPRGQAWLAEQLGEKIQVVNNWKTRGRVPAARYREIAKVLCLTVDQLEGLAPLPWEQKERQAPGLLPEVAQVAAEVNELPIAQRELVLSMIRDALNIAHEANGVKPKSVSRNIQPDINQHPASSKRTRQG